MNISVTELQDEQKYHLLTKLHHNDIVPFVFRYIRKINPVTFVFYVLNILFLAYILKYLMNILLYANFGLKNILLYSASGLIIFPVILIPIHEIIHGLVYLVVGAKRIKFGIDLSQYIFYVTADQFVASENEIIKIAFAPFIIINILLILKDPSHGVLYCVCLFTAPCASGIFLWQVSLLNIGIKNFTPMIT